MPAPQSSSAETVLTLAPRSLLGKNRALYIGFPAFALLFGLVGAWLVTSLQKPAVTPAAVAAPAAPNIERPAPVVAATPAPAEPLEPVPAASAAKSAAAGAKTKARIPSARKKGHDFGF